MRFWFVPIPRRYISGLQNPVLLTHHKIRPSRYALSVCNELYKHAYFVVSDVSGDGWRHQSLCIDGVEVETELLATVISQIEEGSTLKLGRLFAEIWPINKELYFILWQYIIYIFYLQQNSKYYCNGYTRFLRKRFRKRSYGNSMRCAAV